jgi:hypothetical protein
MGVFGSLVGSEQNLLKEGHFSKNKDANIETSFEDWRNYWVMACHSIWNWKNKEKHNDNYNRPYNPASVKEKFT